MELPLKVRPGMSVDHIVDADEKLVPLSGENLRALVALANAHATLPGPPREDGVWDVLVHTGDVFSVERKDGKYFFSNHQTMLDDESIVAHRKHVPMQMPQHEPLEPPHA